MGIGKRREEESEKGYRGREEVKRNRDRLEKSEI